MKKSILVFCTIIIIYLIIGNIVEVNSVMIPNEAIRIRIIPNSNSREDQRIKQIIKTKVQNQMFLLLKDSKGIAQARTIISNNVPLIKQTVEAVFKENNYDLNYKVNYGYHFFPTKNYKGLKYNEGFYESILIEIGAAKGDNWWCVLFPPLCLIEAEESTKIEYKSLVKEVINKYI